jgi:hypothetical protein
MNTPLLKMKKLFLFKGFTYKGIVINENHGLLHFSFELQNYEKSSPVVKICSEIKKNQRRNYFRVKVINEVIVYKSKSLEYFKSLKKETKEKCENSEHRSTS